MRDTQGLKYDDFELAGYNIWRNGEKINAYVDTNTFYSDTVSPGGIYYYSVTAVYDFGQSCLIEPPLEAVMGAKLNTPQGLMAQVLDNQDVLITWNPPDPYTGEWIAWDDGIYFGRIGLAGITEPTSWYAAARFPVTDLLPYNGMYLTEIRFVAAVATTISSYTIKVWYGEDAAFEVVSQLVPNPVINCWNTAVLDDPYLIDATQELWFGVEYTQVADGYPAGRDEFTNNDGKGNLLSFDAIEWEALSVYGIGGDWNIQGWVALEVANYAPAAPLVKKVVQNSGDLAFETVKTDQIATAPAENRGLIGYNLWRNGTKFTYVSAPDTVCTDSNLYPEYYKYYVSAVYDEGESFPEGPAYVTIVGTGDLGGNVFDHETGIPLTDATVVVQGNLYGTTGFEGSYMIEDIPEGTYDVTCEAYGYLINTISDVVIEYQETTVLNFKMEKDSLVNMPVYDSRGNEVRVYPNPLRNYLNIESEGNFREIYLVDYLGRVIMKEDNTYRKQIQIKTTGLAEGVYFIQCYTMEGNMIVKKIVLLR
ncbi:MAG: carboxypeptidase regulatory-like domain-containing protein [Bacteroidales bacterium]|nr:carboxypeptidase regulatory-like domain-containing protein [Bacteroidales bacterium]